MDIFSLAQEINILANPVLNGEKDVTNIKKKGSTLCQYFKDHPEDIASNERTSYHIGSAMYFYSKTISNESESQEFKFALLVASIKLYGALKYGDVQSIISAYRLHLALINNPDFFEPIILELTNDSLASMLNKNHEESKKDIRKFMSYVEYCLFMFCQQDGAKIGWSSLLKEEKEEFQNIYTKYMQKYKIDDFNNQTFFNRGNKMLNALVNVLIEEKLQSYMFLGAI